MGQEKTVQQTTEMFVSHLGRVEHGSKTKRVKTRLQVGRRTTVVAIINKDNTLTFGVSICSPRDFYIRKKGIDEAIKNLTEKERGITVVVPEGMTAIKAFRLYGPIISKGYAHDLNLKDLKKGKLQTPKNSQQAVEAAPTEL